MGKDISKGYYDMEIDLLGLVEENGLVQESFYLNDLKQRKLFLYEDVRQEAVSELVRHIIQYNRMDGALPPEERQPICLFIASNGGEIDAGFMLIDVIKSSKTPVYTVNMGYAYSMGFLIELAGHKRFAMPHAKYLMHDGSYGTYDSGAKAQDKLLFDKQVMARIRDFVLDNSNLTGEEYDSKLRIEWYMFNDEAKEKGFVDYIIGEDCELGEII